MQWPAYENISQRDGPAYSIIFSHTNNPNLVKMLSSSVVIENYSRRILSQLPMSIIYSFEPAYFVPYLRNGPEYSTSLIYDIIPILL
jgi:hypothetical protein